MITWKGDWMQITYKNNINDIVAVSKHMLKSPENKIARNKDVLRTVAFFLIGGVIGVIISQETSLNYFIVTVILYLILVIAASWYTYRKHPRKLAKYMVKTKPELLSGFTITVVSEGIAEQTSEPHNFCSWDDIEVTFTPEYYFLFSCNSLYVIPQRELGEQLFLQLGDEIRKYRE